MTFNSLRLGILAAAAILSGSTQAYAGAVYAYTGNVYTIVANGSYNGTMSINGSVTLSAPLAPTTNLIYTPAAYSLFDGVDTLTESNSAGTFQFATDAGGAIVNWSVALSAAAIANGAYIHSVSYPGAVEDQGSNNCNLDCNSSRGVNFTPGSWTTVSAVPEPSALSLMLAGTVALAAREGLPINVTTFSGGAGTFTAAVNWLSTHNGSEIVNLINNITYVSPGANGELYNNGHVEVYLGNNAVDTAATVFSQAPTDPTRIFTASNCGHDFGCIYNAYKGQIDARNGPDCSNSDVFNQAANSDWYNPAVSYVWGVGQRLYGFGRLLGQAYQLGVGLDSWLGLTPVVTSKIRFE